MPGSLDLLAFAVVLAAAAIAPLGLAVVLPDPRSGPSALRRRLRYLLLGAGLGLPFAFADRGGDFARGAALWWLVVTSITALFVLRRAVSASRARLGELAGVVGYLVLPVGAYWLRAYLADERVAGEGGALLLLAAAHLHTGGLGLSIVASALSRTDDARGALRPLFQLALVGVVASSVWLSLGPTVSGLIRSVGSGVAAGSAVLVGLFSLLHARRMLKPLPRALLAISGTTALFGAGLAAWFVWSGFARLDADRFRFMVASHGLLFAVGTVGLAVVALAWETPAPRRSRAGLTVSALRGGLSIGPSFFADERAEDPTGRERGLVARAADLVAAPHPAVARVLEDTAAHELHVSASWTLLARLLGAPLWAKLVGQLSLPSGEPERLESRVVPLREVHDGRTSPRGLVLSRTRGEDTQSALIAAYATHVERARRYLGVAVPIPWHTFTRVLRAIPLDERGLALTTRPASEGDEDGDEGVYLTAWHGILRLPVDERIELCAIDDATRGEAPAHATVQVTHEVRVLGLPWLSVRSWATPRAPTDDEPRRDGDILGRSAPTDDEPRHDGDILGRSAPTDVEP